MNVWELQGLEYVCTPWSRLFWPRECTVTIWGLGTVILAGRDIATPCHNYQYAYFDLRNRTTYIRAMVFPRTGEKEHRSKETLKSKQLVSWPIGRWNVYDLSAAAWASHRLSIRVIYVLRRGIAAGRRVSNRDVSRFGATFARRSGCAG